MLVVGRAVGLKTSEVKAVGVGVQSAIGEEEKVTSWLQSVTWMGSWPPREMRVLQRAVVVGVKRVWQPLEPRRMRAGGVVAVVGERDAEGV